MWGAISNEPFLGSRIPAQTSVSAIRYGQLFCATTVVRKSPSRARVYGEKRPSGGPMPSQLTKRALEESLKRLLLTKPPEQNHHRRHHQRLRHQSHDVLLSLPGHLRPGRMGVRRGRRTSHRRQQDRRHLADGLLDTFLALRENKPFIASIYHDMSREQVERFSRPCGERPGEKRGRRARSTKACARAGQGLHRALLRPCAHRDGSGLDRPRHARRPAAAGAARGYHRRRRHRNRA